VDDRPCIEKRLALQMIDDDSPDEEGERYRARKQDPEEPPFCPDRELAQMVANSLEEPASLAQVHSMA
jgi:hypothetical protein